MTKHSSDIHDQIIGRNIMLRRKELGMTQVELGAALKKPISFQQVQKYERGTNRVSSSTLWSIAGALGCSILDLYEGFERAARSDKTEEKSKQCNRASRLVAKIHDPEAAELALAMLSVVANYCNKVKEMKQ